MNRYEYLQRAREFAARGCALKQSRLDANKVRYIRKNEGGMTARALASLFGVHYRTIEKVRHYETWVHVK
ncbi:MAG: hypothetical protein DRR04_14260 [Gammaproteobacteria bacterium]|nr:MAG: hypothetical protein DRR04_14260 [Gammaproteobacteria bacterium]